MTHFVRKIVFKPDTFMETVYPSNNKDHEDWATLTEFPVMRDYNNNLIKEMIKEDVPLLAQVSKKTRNVSDGFQVVKTKENVQVQVEKE